MFIFIHKEDQYCSPRSHQVGFFFLLLQELRCFPSGISRAGLVLALASKTVVLLPGSAEICVSLWTSFTLCVHPLKQLRRTLHPNAGDKRKVETTMCIFCRRLFGPEHQITLWSEAAAKLRAQVPG